MTSKLPTLPAGWEWKKLGDIVKIIGGGTPSKDNKSYYNGSILWATVRDMKNDFIEDTELKITEQALKDSATNIIPSQNIVIATRVGLGKVCFLKKDSAINQDLKGIVPKENKADPMFLFYWFKSRSNFLQTSGTGATVKGVKVDFITNLKIPLPPLNEQKRLVSLLDTLFAKIDRSIQLLDENIAAADALLPSTLNTVFGELKENYSLVTLDTIATNHDNQRVPIKESDRSSMKGEYPYYGASGIIDHVNEYIYDGEYLLISEDGANLLIRKYPIAFIAKGKFWVNNHAHVVKAVETKTTNEFLEYSLAYLDISNYITGAAQPKLSQKKLYEIEMVCPPLDIQTQTVAYLDSIRTKVEILKQVQNDKITHLKALKASILDRAFKGEL